MYRLKTKISFLLTVLLIPTASFAGGLSEVIVEAPVAEPEAADDWSFKYVGVSLSYGAGETLAPVGLPGQPLNIVSDDHDIDGYGLGVIAGRNWTRGDFLYGVDAGLAWSGIQGNDADQTTVVNGTDVLAQGYLSGRAGWTFSRTMIYGSAGLGLMWWDQTEQQDEGEPRSNTNTLFGAGPRLAIGIEALVGDGVLRLEAARTHIGQQVGFHPPSAQSLAYDMGAEPILTEASLSYAIKF